MKKWLRLWVLAPMFAIGMAGQPVAHSAPQGAQPEVARVNQGDRIFVKTPLSRFTGMGGYCTAGYIDKDSKRIWTARHCGAQGAVVENDSGQRLGTLHYRYPITEAESLVDITGSNSPYDFAYIQVDEQAWGALGDNAYSGDRLYTPVKGDQLCRYGATSLNTVCGEIVGVDEYLIYAIDLHSAPGDSGGPLWVPGRGFVGTLLGVRSGDSDYGRVTITVGHREDLGFAGPQSLTEETTHEDQLDPAKIVGRVGTQVEPAQVFGAHAPSATELSALLRDYDRQIRQAHDQLAQAQEQAQDKQRAIELLQQQLQQTHPQQSDAARELILAQQQLRSYQKRQELLQAQVDTALYDLQAERLRSTHAREELLKVQKSWEQASATVESLRTQLRVARDISEGQLRADYAAKLVELERAQASLNAAQAQHTTALARVEAAESRVTLAQRGQREANAQAAAAEKRAEAAEAAVTAEREKNQQVTAEFLTAQQRATEAEAQVTQLRHKLDELMREDSENPAQRERIEQLKQELDTAQMQAQQAQTVAEQLRAELERAKTEHASLEQNVRQATTRISELIAEIEDAKVQLAEEKSGTHQALNQKVAELQQQLEQERARRISAVQEAVEREQANAQQLRQRIAELQAQDHEQDAEQLAHAYEKAQARIRALEQEKKVYETGMQEKLQRAVEESARADATLAAAKATVEALRKSEAALKIKVQEQEAENQRLRAQLAKAEGSSKISGDMGLVMGVLGIIVGIIAAVAGALAPLLRL